MLNVCRASAAIKQEHSLERALSTCSPSVFVLSRIQFFSNLSFRLPLDLHLDLVLELAWTQEHTKILSDITNINITNLFPFHLGNKSRRISEYDFL